jgi:hypothetical protein
VLTSHYDPSLPAREQMDGVDIVRAPVAARVSKGVIMPTLGLLATRLAWAHDAVSLHLPQLAPAALPRGRLFGADRAHLSLRLPCHPRPLAADQRRVY